MPLSEVSHYQGLAGLIREMETSVVTDSRHWVTEHEEQKVRILHLQKGQRMWQRGAAVVGLF